MELGTNPVRSLAVTGLNFGLLLTTGLGVPRLVPPVFVLDLSRGEVQRFFLVLVSRARAVATVIPTASGDMLRLAVLHADSPETGFICC